MYMNTNTKPAKITVINVVEIIRTRRFVLREFACLASVVSMISPSEGE
jgi:hypothetical protein